MNDRSEETDAKMNVPVTVLILSSALICLAAGEALKYKSGSKVTSSSILTTQSSVMRFLTTFLLFIKVEIYVNKVGPYWNPVSDVKEECEHDFRANTWTLARF